jgi:hypothetical protein
LLWGKYINFESCDFRLKQNGEMPEQILELSALYQFLNYFFFIEELLANIAEETNLYSSQMNPNKPRNCTVYDIQKFLGVCMISSLARHSSIGDPWSNILGINLVKETVSKTF